MRDLQLIDSCKRQKYWTVDNMVKTSIKKIYAYYLTISLDKTKNEQKNSKNLIFPERDRTITYDFLCVESILTKCIY